MKALRTGDGSTRPARDVARSTCEETPSRSGVDVLLDFIVRTVAPCDCLACERPLGWRPQPLLVCDACRTELPRPPTGTCALCGARAPRRGSLCAGCQRPRPAFDRLHTLFVYEPPVDEMVRLLKFGRLEFLAEDFAHSAAHHLGSILRPPSGSEPLHTVVTSVPLHWRRRLERGYNQSHLVARTLARRLSTPYREVLRRRRATTPQTRLSRDKRRRNVRGCFSVRRLPPRGITLADAHVLLLDDVVTTGATLHEASRALKSAGAAAVTALAIAAARSPGSS